MQIGSDLGIEQRFVAISSLRSLLGVIELFTNQRRGFFLLELFDFFDDFAVARIEPAASKSDERRPVRLAVGRSAM